MLSVHLPVRKDTSLVAAGTARVGVGMVVINVGLTIAAVMRVDMGYIPYWRT